MVVLRIAVEEVGVEAEVVIMSVTGGLLMGDLMTVRTREATTTIQIMRPMPSPRVANAGQYRPLFRRTGGSGLAEQSMFTSFSSLRFPELSSRE